MSDVLDKAMEATRDAMESAGRAMEAAGRAMDSWPPGGWCRVEDGIGTQANPKPGDGGFEHDGKLTIPLSWGTRLRLLKMAFSTSRSGVFLVRHKKPSKAQ